MADFNVGVTLSGVDENGFVWQNVFHLSLTDPAGNVVNQLQATNDFVWDTIGAAVKAAMSENCQILDVASRFVKPDSSYTIHKSLSETGDRAGEQQTGAAAGVIQWYPLEGPQTGRQYVSGLLDADYSNDYISPTYQGLLEDVRDAFLNLTGTDGTYTWIFVLYTHGDLGDPASIDPIIAGTVREKIGILSKRTRA